MPRIPVVFVTSEDTHATANGDTWVERLDTANTYLTEETPKFEPLGYAKGPFDRMHRFWWRCRVCADIGVDHQTHVPANWLGPHYPQGGALHRDLPERASLGLGTFRGGTLTDAPLTRPTSPTRVTVTPTAITARITP